MTINNKWRIDSLLGIGGMASVYAATHRNGSRAALKILHTEFARDPGIRSAQGARTQLIPGRFAGDAQQPGLAFSSWEGS